MNVLFGGVELVSRVSGNPFRQLPCIQKITARARLWPEKPRKITKIRIQMRPSNAGPIYLEGVIYLGIPGNKWPRSLDTIFVLPLRTSGLVRWFFGTSQLHSRSGAYALSNCKHTHKKQHRLRVFGMCEDLVLVSVSSERAPPPIWCVTVATIPIRTCEQVAAVKSLGSKQLIKEKQRALQNAHFAVPLLTI